MLCKIQGKAENQRLEAEKENQHVQVRIILSSSWVGFSVASVFQECFFWSKVRLPLKPGLVFPKKLDWRFRERHLGILGLRV